jgi:Fructose-bisphosphate aldolase class-II
MFCCCCLITFYCVASVNYRALWPWQIKDRPVWCPWAGEWLKILSSCLICRSRIIGLTNCCNLLQGFDSVMADGSHLPLDENISYTKFISSLAHGLTVEYESKCNLGCLSILFYLLVILWSHNARVPKLEKKIAYLTIHTSPKMP